MSGCPAIFVCKDLVSQGQCSTPSGSHRGQANIRLAGDVGQGGEHEPLGVSGDPCSGGWSLLLAMFRILGTMTPGLTVSALYAVFGVIPFT